MKYRVRTTELADQDAVRILERLMTLGAGDAGLRWFHGLNEAIASLANFPQRCPLAPDTKAFEFEVHQLLFGRHPHVDRALFTIEEDAVYILHIRHGRRAPLEPPA